MTNKELREHFEKEQQMICAGRHKGFAFTESYVLWLENKVLDADTKAKEAFEAARLTKHVKTSGNLWHDEEVYADYEQYKTTSK